MSILDGDNDSANQTTDETVQQVDQATAATKLTLEALPEELRNEKMFENLAGKEDAELLTEIAKQLQGAQRLLGNSIRKPTADTGEEGRLKFLKSMTDVDGVYALPDTEEGKLDLMKKLGAPQEASGYNIEALNEQGLNADEINAYRSLAHNAGLTQSQFDGIMEAEVARLQRSREDNESLFSKGKETRDAILKHEWADSYNERMKAAELTANVLGNKFGSEHVKALANSPLRYNPIIVTALAESSKSYVEESSLLDSGTGDFGDSRQEITEKLTELRNTKEFWKGSAEGKRLQKRALELQAKLKG